MKIEQQYYFSSFFSLSKRHKHVEDVPVSHLIVGKKQGAKTTRPDTLPGISRGGWSKAV